MFLDNMQRAESEPRRSFRTADLAAAAPGSARSD